MGARPPALLAGVAHPGFGLELAKVLVPNLCVPRRFGLGCQLVCSCKAFSPRPCVHFLFSDSYHLIFMVHSKAEFSKRCCRRPQMNFFIAF